MTENSAPMTQAEALTALAANKASPEWGAKFLAGDAVTVAESDRLHQIGYSEPGTYQPATGAAEALQALDRFKADPKNAERIARGDGAANAELERLAKAAYPEDADKGEAAAIDPSQYRVPSFGLPNDTEEESQAVAARENQVRGWLQTAEFPADIGNSVLHEAEKTYATWRDASDAERDAYSQKQDAILDRLWGSAKAEKMSKAKQLVNELNARSPGLWDMLAMTGAGSNAAIINSLALAAENLLRKKGASHG